MTEKIEDYFIIAEEKRLEEKVKDMRLKGKSEYQICNYLSRVANIYLKELKGRCRKDERWN